MSAPSEVLAAPAPEEDTDEALMLSYAAGRAAAFDTLYARHKRGVYRYLLRHCGNAGTSDELFQDVWMNAIRARERYAPTAKFTTWLYTIARHRLIDHWRSKGHAQLTSIDDEGDGEESSRSVAKTLQAQDADPQAHLAAGQLGDRLRTALATLPAVQRDAFLLQQEGGLSHAEISELTGVGLETVKSRLRYAIGKLRQELSSLREEFR